MSKEQAKYKSIRALRKINYSLMYNSNPFIKKKILLTAILIYVLNIILRIPGIFQELVPNQFCDEAIYTGGAYNMMAAKSLIPPQFLAGSLNYFLPLLAGKIWYIITSDYPAINDFIIIARLTSAVFIGALMPVFCFLTVCLFNRNRFTQFGVAILATLSPMALGISRLHYPDHYIAGLASLYFYIVTVVYFKHDKQPIGHFAILGVTLALTVSVKWSAILLAPLAAFAIGHYFFRNFKYVHKSKLCLITTLPIVTFICILLILNFHAFFPFKNILEALVFHRNHYNNGNPGLESANGVLFYSQILFTNSVGLFGLILALVGIFELSKSNRDLIVTIISQIFFILVVLGSYRVVYNRNLMIILPLVLILMGAGFGRIMNLIAEFSMSKQVAAQFIFTIILLIEPLTRDIAALVNDIQQDSRDVARIWIENNITHKNSIGFSWACWGMPFNPSNFKNTVYFTFGSPIPNKTTLDYYIMDSWLYEHLGPGNSMYSNLVYSELQFLNPSFGYDGGIRDRQTKFLNSFNLIKTFSSQDYYGPSIFVYRKK